MDAAHCLCTARECSSLQAVVCVTIHATTGRRFAEDIAHAVNSDNSFDMLVRVCAEREFTNKHRVATAQVLSLKA